PVSLTLFDSPVLRDFVRRLLATRDIATIFAFSGQMAQFVPARAPQRFVMDFGDMDSEKFAAYAGEGGLMAPIHRREARTLFAFEVLPKLPNVTFAIVGRNPTDAVRKLASERVLVTGAVEDVRTWLAAADVVVAPLRIARGIQNKVLEAMAMAKPVVASPAAF